MSKTDSKAIAGITPACAGADLRILQRGGGGGSGQEFFRGGVRVQVRGNFHILTSKKNKPGGGVTPKLPPWMRHCCVMSSHHSV